jgi:hypothetical protein
MDDYILARKGLLVADTSDSIFESLFLEATKGLDEHPEGFEHSCQCDLCLFYGC